MFVACPHLHGQQSSQPKRQPPVAETAPAAGIGLGLLESTSWKEAFGGLIPEMMVKKTAAYL